MALEFQPPRSMDQIGLMQEQLRAACQDLDLEGLLAEAVQAAGVAAWSALVLAGAEGLSLSLARQPQGLSLGLAFDPVGDQTPPGLATALFCPPARGAGLRWREGRRVFEVQWDA
ncbi:MAG: hypothetical protein V1806_10215 [Pseudomonadota bacterium]